MSQTKEIYALEYKFGGNVEFLTRIEQLLQRMEKSFRATEVEANKVGDGMAKSFDAADRAVNRTERDTRKLESSLGSVGSKLKALVVGYAGFRTFQAGLAAFSERQMLETNMGTLLGSASAGKDFSNYIKKFAKETPYGMSDLSGVARGLIQYGIPLDETKTYMRQLGDIAMGDRGKMSALGVVLGQVKSAGRLNGQDLMQFINASWNPLTEISEMTGKSMATLRDEMSKGAITFDMVAQAMSHATSKGGQFYGGMEKGAKTLQGRWSTAMDNIKDSLADAFEKNEKKLDEVFRKLGEFNLDGLVSSMARVIDGVVTIADKLFPLVNKLAEIPGLAEAVIGALAIEKLSGIANGFGMITGGVGGLAKALSKANMELVNMGKNGRSAAMGLAAVAGGGAAGFLGGANTSGGVISAGLAAGGTTMAMTGNPLLALLATGGSFVGSLANAGYQAMSYDYAGDRMDIDNARKRNELGLAINKAYWSYAKNGSDENREVLEKAMRIYAGSYGEEAALSHLRGIAGVPAESTEAKASVVNNNVTNNNSVTQNNTISTEFNALSTLINRNLMELMERNLKFDATTAMEVAGA